MITNINIENLSYSKFFAIHSPVYIIINVTYTGTAPDRLLIDISKDINGSWELLNTYRAIPFKDTYVGERVFIFSISELIRGYLENINDKLQVANAFINTQIEKFLIKAYDTESGEFHLKDFYTLPRAFQIGQDEFLTANLDFYKQRPIIALENGYFYAHFFSVGEDISVYLNGALFDSWTGEVGCRRYKFASNSTNELYYNSISVGNVPIELIKRKICSDDLVIKYLDRNGMYCFYNLQKYYSTNEDSVKIGEVNNVIQTSLKNAQATDLNVGYKSNRKISAVAEVENDFLQYFSDIYSSPRVYLQINKTEPETDGNWLQIGIRSGEGLVRASKGNKTVVQLTIELPTQYNITML
jgi:hypothetical protein